MAVKAETVFRKWAMDRFKKIPKSDWMSIQQKGIFGSPDVLGCVNCIFVSLEFKKDQFSKPTKLQEYKRKKISKAGGFAYTIYPENFNLIFRAVLNLAKLNDLEKYIFQQLDNLYQGDKNGF